MPSGRLSLTRRRAEKKNILARHPAIAEVDVVDLCGEAESGRSTVGPLPAQQQHTQRRKLRVVTKKKKPLWGLFSVTSVTIDLCDAVEEDPLSAPATKIDLNPGCSSGGNNSKGCALAAGPSKEAPPPNSSSNNSSSRSERTPVATHQSNKKTHQSNKKAIFSSPVGATLPSKDNKDRCCAPSCADIVGAAEHRKPAEPVVAVASHTQKEKDIPYTSSASSFAGVADVASKEPAETVTAVVSAATASFDESASGGEQHSASPPWPSAYLSYFRRVLQATIGPPVTIHTHLFQANEVQWISDFRALSDAAAGLFCRLLLRNGPWFRTTEKTMGTYHEVSQSSAILDKAINELLQAGFLHQLLKTSTNEQCAAALLSSACSTVVCEFVYESMLNVSAKKRRFRAKCAGTRTPSTKARRSGGRSPRRPRRKSELVQRLMQEVPRQLDVFGRSRSIAPRLLAALSTLDSNNETAACDRAMNRHDASLSSWSSSSAQQNRNKKATMGSCSIGSKRAAVVGISSLRQAHHARRKTLRTRLICLNDSRARLFRRLEFLFGLGSWSSSVFAGLRTPPASSSQSASSQTFSAPGLLLLPQAPRSALMEIFGKMTFATFSCADPLTCRPLFPERNAFVRYEEACIGLSKFEVAVMQGAVSSSSSSSSSSQSNVVALTGFGDSVPECAVPQAGNEGGGDVSIFRFYHWPDYADEIAACASFYLARLLAEQKASAAAAQKDTHRNSEKPLFLRQYEAGSALALIVWLGVDVVQKQRRYEEAVKMLELLLSCPYSRQRRGRWWTRLLIDLDHLRLRFQKQKRAATSQGKAASKPCPAQRVNASWGEDSDSSSEGEVDDTNTTSASDSRNSSPAKKVKIAPTTVEGIHSKGTAGLASVASIQAALNKLDMRIAAAAIAALDDCIHNNCTNKIPSLPSKNDKDDAAGLGLSGNVGKHCHRIGTVQEGVLLSAPDQAALLQRSIAIRKRLCRRFSISLTTSSSPSGGACCEQPSSQRGRSTNAEEDCNYELLHRLVNRVDTAIASAADVALAADWSPPALTIKGTPLNCEAGKKSRFVGYDGSTNVSVEELVLQYFSSLPEGQDPGDGGFSQHGQNSRSPTLSQTISTGWQGIHSEGSVVRSLFALLMWDVVFLSGPDTPVPPQAFLSPFQGGPLDLDTASDSPAGFYLRRKKQADKRLAELAVMNRQQISDAVFKSWTAHFNCLCHGMRWPNIAAANQDNRTTAGVGVRNEDIMDDLFGAPEHGDQSYNHKQWQLTPALLQLIAAGLGGRRLSAVCRRLCVDYHGCRSGFPDLLLWKVSAHCPQLLSGSKLRDSDAQKRRSHVLSVHEFVEQCKLTELTRRLDERYTSDATPSSPAETREVSDTTGAEVHLLRHFTMIPPISSGVDVSIRFAEVKGPRDTLSSQQIEWLRYFNNPDQCEGGIEAHVVHVEEAKKKAVSS